jgi:hypothetical protein
MQMPEVMATLQMQRHWPAAPHEFGSCHSHYLTRQGRDSQVHSHDWMQHNVTGATQEFGGETLDASCARQEGAVFKSKLIAAC